MFFAKLALPLAVAASFVSAITIDTPSGWTSGDPTSLSWQPVAGDPQSFTVELLNTIFHNSFGIANNVQTGALSINLTLPIVPVGDGYTIQFINVGNTSDIFATSSDFSIGATTSTTSSGSSTSAASSGTSVSVASTLSVSGGSTTSGFGSTVSGSSSSSAGSSTGSNTATSASGSATSFNNGAVELGFSRAAMTGYAVMAAAAFAGARLVGF